MARTGRTSARTGLPPFLLASAAIAWISAVIFMGILAYLISKSWPWAGDFPIYSLVVSVLTTVFYLVAFFLAPNPRFVLLCNLVFSYLWLVVVVFVASSWTYSNSPLLHAAEAFGFIAFFVLFFSVLYDWHHGFSRGSGRSSYV